MVIDENSDAFWFGWSATLSLLFNPGAEKVPIYSTLGFLNGVQHEPINNTRDALITLVNAASTALCIATGVYAGCGINKIMQGKNIQQGASSVIGSTLTYIVGTLALRNLGEYIAEY